MFIAEARDGRKRGGIERSLQAQAFASVWLLSVYAEKRFEERKKAILDFILLLLLRPVSFRSLAFLFLSFASFLSTPRPPASSVG